MKKKFATALAVAAATLLCNSIPAQANPLQDEKFWDILIQNDILPGPNAVRSAIKICVAVWTTGASVWDAVDGIYQSNDMSYRQAEVFVAAAIAIYCPPAEQKVA